MLRSLVGSEMCIRDRINTGTLHLPPIFIDLQAAALADLRKQGQKFAVPVTPGVYGGLAPRAAHTASICQIHDGSLRDEEVVLHAVDRRAVCITGTLHLPLLFIDLQVVALRNQGPKFAVPVTPGLGLALRAPHTTSLRQFIDASTRDDRAAHQVLDGDFGFRFYI